MKTHKDLDVWKESIELVTKIYPMKYSKLLHGVGLIHYLRKKKNEK
ncbi:hypothetical protein J7K55_07470 [Candidatus Aerophobetes bacterium]|nr:hypothetical protein [Candidatus Aerophobetes bacterium]